MRRLAVTATVVLMFVVRQSRPVVAQAPTPHVSVRVYVSLSDSVTRYYPVAGHRLIFYRSRTDSSTAVTDSTGAVTLMLAPGDYRLVSAEKYGWRGYDYSWNVPITVRPGMPVIDLRAPDGTPDGSIERRSATVPATAPTNTSQQQSSPPAVIVLRSPKDPSTAAVLSFLVPGAGHIYAGAIGTGIVAFVATGFIANNFRQALVDRADCQVRSSDCASADTNVNLQAALFLTAWVYGMFDAAKAARKYNAERGLETAAIQPRIQRIGGRTVVGLALSLRH